MLCFSEVVETLQEADAIFLLEGLSKDFLNFLPQIEKVAGDIPNSKKFVTEAEKVSAQLNQLYDAKVKETFAKIDVSGQSGSQQSSGVALSVSAVLAVAAALQAL